MRKFHLIRHGARICCKESTCSVRQNWKSRFFSGYKYVRNVLKFWVRQISYWGGFITRYLKFFFSEGEPDWKKGGIIHINLPSNLSFLPFLNSDNRSAFHARFIVLCKATELTSFLPFCGANYFRRSKRTIYVARNHGCQTKSPDSRISNGWAQNIKVIAFLMLSSVSAWNWSPLHWTERKNRLLNAAKRYAILLADKYRYAGSKHVVQAFSALTSIEYIYRKICWL